MFPQGLSAAFLNLCCLLLYQLALFLAPFFTPIFRAFRMTRLFYPIFQRLTSLLRGHTTASAVRGTLRAMSLAVLPTAYVLFTPIVSTKLRMTTSRAN